MEYLALSILGLSIVLSLVHIIIAFRTNQKLHLTGHTALPASELPNACVILCMRGADPALEETLRRLCLLDYFSASGERRYLVRLIVDSVTDPAWELAHRICDELGANHVSIQAHLNRRTGCSLKCGSQLEVLQQIDPEVEVLAFLDADVVPHPTWLKELVEPLSKPGIGVSTGGRWYAPEAPTPGAVTRYLWNVAAQAIMVELNIAWGGTLAIRRDVFDQLNLVDRWGKAICEDTMMMDALKELGLKIQFVPSLMMINRENIQVSSVRRWITRQLLNTRLYHSYWWVVVLHGISVFATTEGGLLVSLLSAWQGEWTAAGISLAAAAGFQFTLCGLLWWLERGVSRAIGERKSQWGNVFVWGLLPIWMIPVQTLNLWCIFRAQFARKVEWRGVTYEVLAPFQIRVIEEQTIIATATHSL